MWTENYISVYGIFTYYERWARQHVNHDIMNCVYLLLYIFVMAPTRDEASVCFSWAVAFSVVDITRLPIIAGAVSGVSARRFLIIGCHGGGDKLSPRELRSVNSTQPPSLQVRYTAAHMTLWVTGSRHARNGDTTGCKKRQRRQLTRYHRTWKQFTHASHDCSSRRCYSLTIRISYKL